MPVLTVAYHPDLERIGDRAVLTELAAGNQVDLARTGPDFVAPGHRNGLPLGDRGLSRQPLVLRAVGGSIELDTTASRTRVVADGVSYQGRRRFDQEDLGRGVVLELSGRVTLVLGRRVADPEDPGLSGIEELAGAGRLEAAARRVAELAAPVLLRGEVGSGKERLAAAIHHLGARRDRPFVAVNLGALAPSRAAAELFGAARSGGEGGTLPTRGHIHRAAGGTLFLDDVGETTPEVLAALSRVLETGEIVPAGSPSGDREGRTPTPVRVDVRVLAGSDAGLEAMTREGEFPVPLFERLAGCEIDLPPLRECREDIGRLVLRFLREELAAIGESHRFAAPDATVWLPPSLLGRLIRFDWPGNVRELRSTVRHLVAASRGRPAIVVPAGIERLLEAEDRDATRPEPFVRRDPLCERRRRASEVTDHELVAVLRIHRWDAGETAKALHLSLASLFLRMAECPRVRTAGDLDDDEIRRAQQYCGGDLEAMVERLEVSARALGRRVRELGL